ncbi:MAG: cysteine peptidase family C39 domain-containing protein [Acidobacteriota bacterium]
MMIHKKYLLITASIVLIALLSTLYFFYKRKSPEVLSIPAVGGRVEARFHFAESPIFLQTDSRWATQEIGGSREPLRAVGCTICSLSMALAHYDIEMTPDALNEKLKAQEGFTEQGWLKWNKIASVTEQKIRVDIPTLSHEAIDHALKSQQPVIAKILLNGSIQHWVLIVGKSGQEYLIKDPLGDGRSLEPLSKFGSDIFAIRVVAKNNA